MQGLLDRRILVTATVCALAAVAVTLLLLRPRPVEVVAGPADTSAACVAAREHWPVTVAGQERMFLQDGDTLTIRASARGPEGARIDFGEVTATILPARC